MYIYKTTNNVNKKQYVGLSTFIVEDTIDYYGSGVLIKKALQKYGKENFTKIILYKDIKDLSKLKSLERSAIALFDTFNNGYNLTLGGDGIFGFKHTEESKEKNRQSKLEYYKTHESVKKGIKCTSEQIEKNRKAQLLIWDDVDKRDKQRQRMLMQLRENGSLHKMPHTQVAKNKLSKLVKIYVHANKDKYDYLFENNMTDIMRQKISNTKLEYYKTHDAPMKDKVTCLDIELDKLISVDKDEFHKHNRIKYFTCRTKEYTQWKTNKENL